MEKLREKRIEAGLALNDDDVIGFLALIIVTQPEGPTPMAIKMAAAVPETYWEPIFESVDRIERAVSGDDAE